MNALPQWVEELVSPLDDKLGLVLTEVTPERAVGSIPVDGNEQPFGALHGGATAALVETLASLSAVAYGRPDRIGVGVDLNLTHLRAAHQGRVTGTATAIHLGGTLAIYRVDVTDDSGSMTATGQLTCRLLEASRHVR